MLRVFQHISKHEKKKKKNGRVRKEIKENVTSLLSSIFLTFFNSSSSRLFERKRVWIPLCRSTFACELIFIQLPSTRIGRHRSRNNRGERVTRDEQPNKIVGSTSVWPRSRIAIQSEQDAGRERAGRALRSAVQHRGCCTSSIRAVTHLAMFPSSGHGISLYEITNLIFLFFLSHVVTIFP